MENLENFGVQDLNADEIKTTQGGVFPLIAIVLFDVAMTEFLAGAAYETYFPTEY